MKAALPKLINLTVFLIGWFICIVYGGSIAVVYTLLALFIHAVYVLKTNNEWYLIAIMALLGLGWDLSLTSMGVLTFPDANNFAVPLWLLCLWVLFTTTFNHCLAWMHNRLYLSGVLAIIFGPLSYWAGAQLSDARIEQPLVLSMILIACGWVILFPLGIYWARKLNVPGSL